MRRVEVIDSHTGGEPTRVVLSGAPDLGPGSLAARRDRFARDLDGFRAAVVEEPRGSDILVGALLCEPVDPSSCCGVIFFNNVGPLGMCGHGAMGVVASLRHLGRIDTGCHRIETPVGTVVAELHPDGAISIENVPSYRHRAGVGVEVEGHGRVVGDVAWGGNWFFLVREHGQALDLARVDALVDFSWRVRQALRREGITGDEGAEIDHVELFGPSEVADSRNFVLCPGRAYDRSPCGTGTSAKLACLHADGELPPEGIWRQESIVGSVFEGRVRIEDGQVIPVITGRAWVHAETMLLLDPSDPFCWGLRHRSERSA